MNPNIENRIISIIDSDNPSTIDNIQIINSTEKILEEPDIKNVINSKNEKIKKEQI